MSLEQWLALASLALAVLGGVAGVAWRARDREAKLREHLKEYARGLDDRRAKQAHDALVAFREDIMRDVERSVANRVAAKVREIVDEQCETLESRFSERVERIELDIREDRKVTAAVLEKIRDAVVRLQTSWAALAGRGRTK